MVNLSDEMLMAYADGQLSAQDRARVDAILKSDPESRARLRVFMATGPSLGLLFQQPMNEPPPAHLVEFVLKHRPRTRSRRTASQRPSIVLGTLRKMFPWDASAWHIAFASGAMIVSGMAGGWLLRGAFTGPSGGADDLVAFEDGTLFAEGMLQRALEAAPSGKEVALSSAAKMKATLTFKSHHQTYCREYEIVTGASENYAGLGCRNEDGKWAIQVNAATANHRAHEDKTAPAGNENLGALEAAIDKLMEGDALGREEEATLIKNGWRK